MKEQVNHPKHYGGDTPYEVIKVLDAWGFGEPFCIGNAIKYLARAGKKGPKGLDYKKALFYAEHLVNNYSKD